MLADNSTLRGPLSLSELQYGTQDESSSSLRLRLVAIYLEQLQDKDNRTMDSTADLLMQKKKYLHSIESSVARRTTRLSMTSPRSRATLPPVLTL